MRLIKRYLLHLFAYGVGKPTEEGEFPNAWAKNDLCAAINNIEKNSNDIVLRTVQNWFNFNSIGISRKNIYWVTVIFGGGNEEAKELVNRRLTFAKIKSKNKHNTFRNFEKKFLAWL